MHTSTQDAVAVSPHPTPLFPLCIYFLKTKSVCHLLSVELASSTTHIY